MSGVTHFERRDRQKTTYAECRFCGKKIKGTPGRLAGEKGYEWVENWMQHIRNHFDIPENLGALARLDAALRTAMSVAREYDRNK